jgi:hypothetical protein
VSAAATVLQAELMQLVERHGLAVVTTVLGTIQELPAATSSRKSAKYAVTYEGTLITETERAILWWIPARGNPESFTGQATWIPRVMVIEMTRGEAGKLGTVRVTRPVEWHYARRIGKSVDFLRGVRS